MPLLGATLSLQAARERVLQRIRQTLHQTARARGLLGCLKERKVAFHTGPRTTTATACVLVQTRGAAVPADQYGSAVDQALGGGLTEASFAALLDWHVAAWPSAVLGS